MLVFRILKDAEDLDAILWRGTLTSLITLVDNHALLGDSVLEIKTRGE